MSGGECVAVTGPSGGGKTLLLRAVADLDPNEGKVTLDGRDRSTMSAPQWRRLVGYMPAEPGWWGETVGEHFADWETARPILETLGIEDAARRFPIARMSTGERLRLALARALVMRPRILLLDEPTAALDPSSVVAVEALIASRLSAELGVLWVSHDPVQARRVAHRQLVVEAGLVREEGERCPTTSS